MNRRLGTRLLLGAVVLLVILRFLPGVELSWGLRGAGALLVATLTIRWGLASMRPLHVGAKSYEPVDVVEEAGIPVYSCKQCGTQLVLLRKGSDKAPRHCGEAMTLSVVADDADSGLDPSLN
jgi:hypothetical protein